MGPGDWYPAHCRSCRLGPHWGVAVRRCAPPPPRGVGGSQQPGFLLQVQPVLHPVRQVSLWAPVGVRSSGRLRGSTSASLVVTGRWPGGRVCGLSSRKDTVL